jgi:hypothetical protein
VNSYEAKKQARIDRLSARAESLSRQSESVLRTAKARADIIPFGQPILVGHHSEGRDRRYREKIRNGFDKGFALAKEAREVAGRAYAAENSTAVSSDDPEAIVKLKEKLGKLEKLRDRMVEINKELRASKDDAGVAARTGLKVEQVASLRQPDELGRVGFPSYKLTNTGSEIRRLKARIEELGRKAERVAPEPETVGPVKIAEEDNRLRIFFPGKPSEDFRRRLKGAGFRFSPTEGAWQRMPSAWVWSMARQFATEYAASLAPAGAPAAQDGGDEP